jgi:glucose/arabinose dehydrogenase
VEWPLIRDMPRPEFAVYCSRVLQAPYARLLASVAFSVLSACSAKSASSGNGAEPTESPIPAKPSALPAEAVPPTPALAGQNDTLVLPPASLANSVTLERVHRGLSKPLGLEFFSGDALKRIFVVEQTGTVRAITNDTIEKEPLLDVKKLISRGHSEQGLLGLAFHPAFKDNGLVYINYTDRDGETRVVQYRSTTGANAKVDPNSAVVLLSLEQPWRNHNGGYLAFGPDGLLYVGTGDGGAADDPKRASQAAENRLGKMLRINVDTKEVKTIQSGLRNPWRYTFDRKTGDLYIADVGQNKWEEVSVVVPDAIEGANFGWSMWEGKHCFRKANCSADGMTAPAIEFDHATGCSITGGIVYRGAALPALDGAYFYSDFCTAILRSFRWNNGVVSDHWDWKDILDPKSRLAEVSAIAEDEDGEMYLLSIGGGIYKLVPKSP